MPDDHELQGPIAYITAFVPYGDKESFVLEEICAVKKVYDDMVIVPRDLAKGVFSPKACGLVAGTVRLPLLNAGIFLVFLGSFFSWRVWNIMGALIKGSRNFKIGLKNLVVLPKSVYLAGLLKRKQVRHIHAHWAGTTTTMAYIIHCLTKIPYSFTLHRWDIDENNMLKEKVSAACFARCISEKGKKEVLSLVGSDVGAKIQVVHMGVAFFENNAVADICHDPFIVMTPANLAFVKGHQYMIDACRILKERGVRFQYWIVGDGAREKELKRAVGTAGLADRVVFYGRLPHEELMRMYQGRRVDAVVLPSINTTAGEQEGIPVALMEAMSYGVPVIATNTGAVAELMGNGEGILVGEKDAAALAQAIERLLKDKMLRAQLSRRGREKVKKDFFADGISQRLVALFTANTQDPQ